MTLSHANGDPAPIGDALRRWFDEHEPDAIQPDMVRLMLELSHDRPPAPPVEDGFAVASPRSDARVVQSWWSRALLAIRR